MTAPPSGALAAPVDAASIVSRVQLRASRRATGRQISGTELPAYAFSAWVEGPDDILNRIESVQYEFNHPTFRQKLQVGRDRRTGFRVGYTGWGCLSSVIVTLRLRDRSVTPPHIDLTCVRRLRDRSCASSLACPDRIRAFVEGLPRLRLDVSRSFSGQRRLAPRVRQGARVGDQLPRSI